MKVSHPTHVRRGVFESVSQERCGVDSDSLSPYGTRIFLPKKEENSAREISQWMMETRLLEAQTGVSDSLPEYRGKSPRIAPTCHREPLHTALVHELF